MPVIKWFLLYWPRPTQTSKDYTIYTDATHQMVSAVLAQTYLDRSKDYIICTDASHYIVSAILAHHYRVGEQGSGELKVSTHGPEVMK